MTPWVKRKANKPVKFLEKLEAASQKNDSLLGVGLDPERVRLPPQYLY